MLFSNLTHNSLVLQSFDKSHFKGSVIHSDSVLLFSSKLIKSNKVILDVSFSGTKPPPFPL